MRVTKAKHLKIGGYFLLAVLASCSLSEDDNRANWTLTLSANELKLAPAGRSRLSAVSTPDPLPISGLTWQTSDSRVVVVDSQGLVRAIAPGNATISVYSENPKVRAECSVVVAIPDVRLSLVSEGLLFSDAWYPNAVSSLDGQSIYLALRSRVDDRPRGFLSLDAGETWATAPVGPEVIRELQDGSFITLKSLSVPVPTYDPSLPIRYEIEFGRASSLQKAAVGDYSRSRKTIDIPDLDELIADDGNRYVARLDHGFAQTESGDLVATMYGNFKSDVTGVAYLGASYRQLRSWVIVSHDQGSSWGLLSVIADTVRFPLSSLAEGYDEPDLISLGGQELISVMRTGGNPGSRPSRYGPLFASRSTDGGASWSKPSPISSAGVMPKLLKLNIGTLVCLSGRPGVFLLISTDKGKTWEKKEDIVTTDGTWGSSSSGYGALWATGDDKFCVVYDTFEGGRMVVKTRRYNVRLSF